MKLFMFLLVGMGLAYGAYEMKASNAIKPTPSGTSAFNGKTVSQNWYEGGEGYRDESTRCDLLLHRLVKIV